VSVVLVLAQFNESPLFEEIDTVGGAFTETVTVLVAVQPEAPVAVTV
jgi:hypothetical protein